MGYLPYQLVIAGFLPSTVAFISFLSCNTSSKWPCDAGRNPAPSLLWHSGALDLWWNSNGQVSTVVGGGNSIFFLEFPPRKLGRCLIFFRWVGSTTNQVSCCICLFHSRMFLHYCFLLPHPWWYQYRRTLCFWDDLLSGFVWIRICQLHQFPIFLLTRIRILMIYRTDVWVP